jgi:3-oxoacyl-[acyl-carrier-protein] synthase II
MAMRDSILPPTINYEYPDPQCDLDWVPNHPRRNRVERAMVFTHGFNGSDAAVVIGRAPPA